MLLKHASTRQDPLITLRFLRCSGLQAEAWVWRQITMSASADDVAVGLEAIKLTEVAGNEGNPSLEKLESLGVAYTLYQHPEATTVEEQAVHVGGLPGVLTKNLLLRVRAENE